MDALNPTAISLFSGAGGMDVGFSDAGFEILFANDIDPTACETYALNHGKAIRCGALEDFLPGLRSLEGSDVVFGGPPCQGFSVAGKMDPRDPRSQLIWRFLDAVKLTNPKVFVCENVKALALLSRWSDMRVALLSAADSAGYHATIVVLNASDYGVPQARERMFLIGVRKDFVPVEKLDLRSAILAGLRQFRSRPETVGHVVTRLGRAGSENNRRVCKAVVTFARSPVLRPSPYAGMMFNGAGRPVRANGFACTLPASMGGNKTPIVDEGEIFDGCLSYVEEYHSELMKGRPPRRGEVPPRLRRLTVDEALAIQGFPPGYKLAGPQSAVFRQIGNAVPCGLAEAVGQVVRRILSGRRDYLSDALDSREPYLESQLLLLEEPGIYAVP